MEVIFTKEAQDHLQFWKKTNNRKIQNRITLLITAILDNPFRGIGNPEALKHDLNVLEQAN
jgi:toxin YoeB